MLDGVSVWSLLVRVLWETSLWAWWARKSKQQPSNIHLLDRTETNIIFIWSGKVILGEAKPSPNITLPDQINMILDEVLSNKCLIIAAHVVCTQSIARFIDPDQEAIYHVACSTPLYKSAYWVIYFRTWNYVAFELATVWWNQVSSVSNLMNV